MTNYRRNFITNYMNLVKKEARRISRLHSLSHEDHEDLVGQGNVILCQCAERFNPALGVNFSVYLRASLREGLKGAARKCQVVHSHEIDFTDVPEIWHMDRTFSGVVLDEILDSLSDRARFVVDLVLACDPPVDFSGGWGRRACRESIHRFLRKQGWAGCQITAAFHEIQSALVM